MTTSGLIAKQYLDSFPDTPSHTLAKLMYKDHPLIWSSVETARNAIRYRRGSTGEWNKHYLTDTTHVRPTETAANYTVPKGKRQNHGWRPLVVSKDSWTNALILSDLHIPYHDEEAIDIAIEDGQNHNTDLVVLNGDLIDFYACSYWETDPRMRNLKEEIEVARSMIRVIRGAFPKARILYKLGNHCERWEMYLMRKAPELLGIEDFELDQILRLKESNIEIVDGKKPIVLDSGKGQLHLVHGHEFQKTSIAAPVNPARGLYLRSKENSLCGHHHQSSEHTEKSLGQNIVTCWSTGCLCDMHPIYCPINKWNLGYARVTRNVSKGGFRVKNLKLLNGEII